MPNLILLIAMPANRYISFGRTTKPTAHGCLFDGLNKYLELFAARTLALGSTVFIALSRFIVTRFSPLLFLRSLFIVIISFVCFLLLRSAAGVDCFETMAGLRCGRCPAGMIGDGKICKPGVTCAERPCYV